MSDYIERDAILREPLFHLPQRKEKGMPFPVISVHSMQNLIKNFPAADVQPVVRGEWEDTEKSYAEDLKPGERQTCRCSVCKLTSERPVGYFCKWCGADMREALNERV